MAHCDSELCKRTRIDTVTPVAGKRGEPLPASCQCDCDGCIDTPDPVTVGLVVDGVNVPVALGGVLQLDGLGISTLRKLHAQLQIEVLAMQNQIERRRQEEADGRGFDRDWFRAIKIARNIKDQQILAIKMRIRELGGGSRVETLIDAVLEYAKIPGELGDRAREAIRQWKTTR